MIVVIISLSILCIILGVFSIWTNNKKLRAENQAFIISERCAILEESIAAERTQINAQREQLISQFQAERAQINAQFTEQFKALASDILEQKSRSMTATNRESLDALLKPFGEQIDRFRTRVEEEAKHRFALQQEVARLADLNAQITREANNLTSALKGNSKIQGDWGEMILQTLLESSGLKRDKHFFIQENLKDADGNNLRPDVILQLPEQKQVVLDSKVSLTAYADYTQADDEETRKTLLGKHLSSVKKHIDELGTKRYQSTLQSPDFTIMFIPNEPAFLLALQADNNLWTYAYQRGVILSSPTNLFAILRIVEDPWRRDLQSRHALEIAIQGGNLYDKFVLFLSSFDNVGRAISKAEDAYEETKKHLVGKGNLISRTEKLRTLGAKASKQIAAELIEPDDDEQLIIHN